MFYKMCNSLSPAYLSSLVPPTVHSISRYHLRNENDLQTVNARTTVYYQSILPSVVRDWDSLPDDHRNAITVDSFKCHLKHNKQVIPIHFNIGHKKLQVLHTRLRTKCSALNYDLFIKRYCSLTVMSMRRGRKRRTLLFEVHFYRNQLAELISTVSQFHRVIIDCLLRGNNNLPKKGPYIRGVQAYIKDSKRF